MKGFLRFLILAVLPLGILISVLLWTPLLEIRTLDVTGQEKCSTEEVLQASGLAAGANPLLPIDWRRGEWPRPNLISASERIRRLPWIENASVDWLPLHTVRIRIVERKPFAFLPYLGGSLMLDANGVVLESVNGDLPADVREIRGIHFSGYANGRLPDTEDPQLLQSGLGVLKALKRTGTGDGPRLFDVVRWVDVLSTDRVLVSLEDRVTVRFDPTVELQYKVDFTSEIFFRHVAPGEKGMIDFTRGDDPAFIPE